MCGRSEGGELPVASKDEGEAVHPEESDDLAPQRELLAPFLPGDAVDGAYHGIAPEVDHPRRKPPRAYATRGGDGPDSSHQFSRDRGSSPVPVILPVGFIADHVPVSPLQLVAGPLTALAVLGVLLDKQAVVAPQRYPVVELID